jgi:uncharacterized Zn-binding protein involved in type VI secretion
MVTGVVPHVGGPILPPGAPTVLIDFLPAANVTTMATCVGPPDVIVLGSMGVMINFLPAARIGDMTAHGGVIVMGSPTCIIGEVGMSSPGAGGLGGVVAGLAAGGVLNPIENASTFKTYGLDRNAADKFLSTPDGELLLDELGRSDPTATPSQIYVRAVDQLSTGSNSPTVVKDTTSPLVKIVPQGKTVSEFSPFFTTPEELRSAAASGKGLSDYFGLPLKSSASTYDVYKIVPKAPATVFVSKVAPTSELGGAVRNSGGGSQTIVANRNVWSAPVKVGTI